jgi:hypothetical protein
MTMERARSYVRQRPSSDTRGVEAGMFVVQPGIPGGLPDTNPIDSIRPMLKTPNNFLP